MSKFEYMCYLIVERQKANKKRRLLLQRLHSALKKYGNNEWTYKYQYYKALQFCNAQKMKYRDHADKMTEIARDVYSPVRKELKASIKYDGSNNCTGMYYDKEYFKYSRIKEIAAGYIFDEVVLRNRDVVNPYSEVL